MYIKCITHSDLESFKKGKTYNARIRFPGKLEVRDEEYRTRILNIITFGNINIYSTNKGDIFMSNEDINAVSNITKRERKPLLILCNNIRSDYIDTYIKKVLYIDSKSYRNDDVKYYPFDKDIDYEYYINNIKKYKPFAVVPRTLEFIDALLNSDIEFKIVEIYVHEGEIKEKFLTKEELLEKRKDSNFLNQGFKFL